MLLGTPLECNRITATAGSRAVLVDASLSIGPGETVAVVGPSGSGKTTLLNCVAGLWPVNEGEIRVDGRQVTSASRSARSQLRRERVGYVFQFGELLPELTVGENVGLPRRLVKDSSISRVEVSALLQAVGLEGFEDRDVQTLSGGETQRVAIARSLSNSPALLLADEPTGSVDEEQSAEIVGLLVATVKQRGAGLLVATHDPAVARRMDRVVRLHHGHLTEYVPASR